MTDLTKLALADGNSGVRSGKAIALNAVDADGVMTLTATLTDAHTYTIANFDGALVTPPGSGRFAVPRNVTVTTTADAATYNTTDPIIVTGIRAWDGVTVAESIYLLTAGGDETIVGTTLFASVITIAVPAQLTTNGEFTFGCGTAALATGSCTGVITPDGVSNNFKGNNHRNSGGGARGIYVGTSSAAELNVMLWDDQVTTLFSNISAGEIHPLWFKSIHEGTTATDLVACK